MKRFYFTIVFLIQFVALQLAFSLPIDLTERDIYVRKGFRQEWTASLPVSSNEWQRVPSNKGKRPVRVRDLKIEGLPKFRHFSLTKHASETFTFITSFTLSHDEYNGKSLGLFLPQIGQNWEIFLNGKSIEKQVYLNDNGSIRIERAVRGEILELDRKYLKEGENILAFRIIGDPTDDRTGFFMEKGYLIDRFETLTRNNTEYIDIMLISLYCFFGIYHLLLYLFRRKDLFYFFYGINALAVSLYLFTRTYTSFRIIQDTLLHKNIELFCLFLIFAAFIIFTDLIVRKKTTLFSKIYGTACLLFSITILFAWKETILRIWQATVIIPLLYILIFNIVIPTLRNFKRIYSEKKDHPWTKRLLGTVSQTMIREIPGNLFIGILIIVFSTMIDILNVNRGYATTYTKYAYFFIFMGIVFILSNRFIEVHRRMEELAERLELKVKERTAELEDANEEIRKFAFIVSHDMRAPLINIKGFSKEISSSLADIHSNMSEILKAMPEKKRGEMNSLLENDIPESFGFINASVQRMDTMINAILNLSRIGRRELKREQVDLNEIMNTVLKSLSHQLEAKRVRAHLSPLPTVTTDRISIEQIFGNLLDNAVKYLSGERDGDIAISHESDGRYEIIRIRDNGRGMSKEDIPKAFEIFRRVGVQNVPGEGMGLAYVQTLVKRLGGRIWCESELNIGTTFSFSLPLVFD